MAKRSTIGQSPLDAYIQPTQPKPTTVPLSPEPVAKPSKQVKERLTIHLPIDLIDRVKNVVFWSPGLTLAGLAEQALSKAVAELEQERGEPFPPRRSELKGGRPMK